MKLATICYIIKNEQTLMLNRNKKEKDIHKNKWVPVGGKQEEKETPEDCIKREIKEEAGIKIKNPELKALIAFYNNSGRIEDDYLVWVYTTREFTGTPKKNCKEGTLQWQPNTKIINGELPMWPGDKIFSPWIYQKKYFIAELEYKGKEFTHKEKFYESKEEIKNAIKPYLSRINQNKRGF